MTSQAPPVRARKKRSKSRAREVTDVTDVADAIDVTAACHATDDGQHKAVERQIEPPRGALVGGDDDWIARLDLPVD